MLQQHSDEGFCQIGSQAMFSEPLGQYKSNLNFLRKLTLTLFFPLYRLGAFRSLCETTLMMVSRRDRNTSDRCKAKNNVQVSFLNKFKLLSKFLCKPEH